MNQKNKSNIEILAVSTAPQEIMKENAASYDVYKQLRRDIITSKLNPNDRLRFEVLKDIYGAGVGTLREALSHLVSDGLVRTEVGKGFRVAPVSSSDLIDVTNWRVKFEVEAVLKSIELGDDDWEAEIVTAFHLLSRLSPPKFGAPLVEWEKYAVKHERYHNALVAGCGSPWLLHFRSVLLAQARRYQALAVKSSEPLVYRNTEDHRVIMDAVLARDEKTSATLIEAHIRRTSNVVLEQLSSSDVVNF